MLPIEWIFANYDGHTSVGFRELIVALSVSPFDSLFSTELIVTLIELFWERYYAKVFYRCFIPFIVYFLATQIFVSIYAIEGINPDGSWFDKNAPIFLATITILGVLFFLFFEIAVMARSFKKYFFDVFNYVDLSSFACNLVLVYYTFDHNYQETSGNVREVASLCTVLMWIKVFYWMRLFTSTSFYVKLIRETLYDIRYFIILFIIILMTFANALFISNQGRDEDVEIFKNFLGVRGFNAVMNQYMLSLGEFDTENY